MPALEKYTFVGNNQMPVIIKGAILKARSTALNAHAESSFTNNKGIVSHFFFIFISFLSSPSFNPLSFRGGFNLSKTLINRNGILPYETV